MYITYLTPLQANISSFVSHMKHMYQNYRIISNRMQNVNNITRAQSLPEVRNAIKLRNNPGKKLKVRRLPRGMSVMSMTQEAEKAKSEPNYLYAETPKTPRARRLSFNDAIKTPKKRLSFNDAMKTPKKKETRSLSLEKVKKSNKQQRGRKSLPLNLDDTPIPLKQLKRPILKPRSPSKMNVRRSLSLEKPKKQKTQSSTTAKSLPLKIVKDPIIFNKQAKSPPRDSQQLQQYSQTPIKSNKQTPYPMTPKMHSRYKSRVFSTPKSRTRHGGAPKKSYIYIDIIKVWHLFDTKHDFKVKYKIIENKINNIETSVLVKELYKDFIENSLKESSIANELLLYGRNKNNDKIKHNLFNLKIYYKKSLPDIFELKKKAFQAHKNVPTTIGQFLFKNKAKKQSFYLQDIHINNMTSDAWRLFETNVLKQISNKVVPFEKLWDPLISTVSAVDSDDYPCKNYQANIDRVNYIYNKSLTEDEIENEFAFRKLTKEYFNISFECVNNKYKGITFILTKTNGADAEEIKKTYTTFIKYINSTEIEFNVFQKNNKVCITADINGFSIENIKEVLKFLQTKELLIHSNLTNNEYLKKYSTYDNRKTLILFFICHIYFKPLKTDIEIIKAILYDFKKSGDWGQALYCKYMNQHAKDTTTCFVSGDMLSAFYSVLHGTPTIIGSSRPKNEEEEYNQLQIYTGNTEFTYAYIENMIVSYMKNELLNSLKQYKDIHNDLKAQISQIESQWDTYIQQITTLLKPDNFQNTSDITFNEYPKAFFDLIIKSKENAYANASQDIIKQILVQFLELYNLIWQKFKSLKPEARLEVYIDNFNAIIIRHYDDERNKLFVSAQAAFAGNEVRDKLAIQKICYDGLNLFKDALNYCNDILYIVYVFIIDINNDDEMETDEDKMDIDKKKDIYSIINQFAKNMLYYLITTKAFLHQNPDIRDFRSPFNMRDMLPELNNPHSSLLKDILQKESQSQNVNNPREKAVQEFSKIYWFYEMMVFDIQDMINTIKYDIIGKITEIESDTPIYIFKGLFNALIIPKINHALTFNIMDEIEKICENKMIPLNDCNRIKATFPILANFNSIYNISEFIFKILEDLEKKVDDNLRPYIEETMQKKDDDKIEKQILRIGQIVDKIKVDLATEYAYDGEEKLHNFITEKLSEIETNRTKKKRTDGNTVDINELKKKFRKIQKELKKIEKDVSELYTANPNHKGLKTLLQDIMDTTEFNDLTRKQKSKKTTGDMTGPSIQITSLNDKDIDIRLPRSVADIKDKIGNTKNEVKNFQRFINIGYI